MNTKDPIVIFWHRRDLRLHDNAGLHHALSSGLKVLPCSFLTQKSSANWGEKRDARVEFIHKSILQIKKEYEQHNSSILVKHGKHEEVFIETLGEYNVKEVFTNNDYEPYARQRDNKVAVLLASKGVAMKAYKDHVIFEKDEILKSDGSPYVVYTPYMKRWKELLSKKDVKAFEAQSLLKNLLRTNPIPAPSLEEIGFLKSGIEFPDALADPDIVRKYHLQRNLPAVRGTTRIGMHLRFGTLSTREMVRFAMENNETWLNELIWREFFQMILYHFPHTVDKSFKPAYDRIEWLNEENKFKAWCEGLTGFPIVDAGMRELAQTGFMHNRVRMITGSFLVKHLLIDWRWGEAWFAEKLLDYEQASNVGNWQWVAGCGCDAAPYFRVFNPELQAKKFDPDGEYIKRWVPEINSKDYPEPIVDHAGARELALKTYKKALETS